jgi:hypothetical protein
MLCMTENRLHTIMRTNLASPVLMTWYCGCSVQLVSLLYRVQQEGGTARSASSTLRNVEDDLAATVDADSHVQVDGKVRFSQRSG